MSLPISPPPWRKSEVGWVLLCMAGCFVREAQGSLYHLVGALVVANGHLGVDQSFSVGKRKMLRRKLAGNRLVLQNGSCHSYSVRDSTAPEQAWLWIQ